MKSYIAQGKIITYVCPPGSRFFILIIFAKYFEALCLSSFFIIYLIILQTHTAK